MSLDSVGSEYLELNEDGNGVLTQPGYGIGAVQAGEPMTALSEDGSPRPGASAPALGSLIVVFI